MAKLIVGVNDLKTKYPEIAKQWHPTKNGDLTPSQVACNSHSYAWWLCPIGHAYRQTIIGRTKKNFKCHYCSGHGVLEGFNDLAHLNPELAKEWHPSKNGNFKPTQVTTGSGKKVWWLCPIGHEYEAVVRERHNGTKCPTCDIRRQSSFAEQAILYYIRKLYPDAIGKYKEIFSHSMELDIYIPSIKLGIEFDGAAWHSSETTLDREIRKYNKCKEHGIKLIRFKEQVYNTITDGNGQKQKIEVEPRHDVADEIYTVDKVRTGEELEASLQYFLDQLDPQSNMWTRRNPLMLHSSVQVNIERDMAEIQSYLVKLENSLANLRPDVLDKWDYDENRNLKPEMFSVSSNQQIKWKCPTCGHKWTCSINSMTRKGRYGCAECAKAQSGKTFTARRVKERGSLAENNPSLAAQWHPTLNGDLTPDKVTTSRFQPVWWLCEKCGCEWESSPNNRSKGVGCPHCAGRVALPGVDDIVTLHSERLAYWDYDKNKDLDPTRILSGSGQKAKWHCRYCGHKWEQVIHRRLKSKYYCPKCKDSKIVMKSLFE